MASIADLLENELKAALEVRDERSLHNYVTILVDNLVRREEYMSDSGSMKSDIRAVVDSMREGFRRMDDRFEAVDKRFEAMDKRFDDLIGYMNKRFEAVDRRFGDQNDMMNARFAASDRRFDDLIGQMNSRFNMMFYFMSAGFTILTVLMTLYRFIG